MNVSLIVRSVSVSERAELSKAGETRIGSPEATFTASANDPRRSSSFLGARPL